jgi:4-hydroxybenzoate polyprenyltransferase
VRAHVLDGLARSSHPEPVCAVTAGVTGLAYAAGRGPAGTAWVGLAVLTGQLSIGWSNDYLDRDADLAAGRADKPVALSAVPPRLVAVAAITAAICCVPASLASGWRAGLAGLTTVAAGWIYNVDLKRTVCSPLPFIPGFGLFPAFVTLGLPGHPWPAWWALTAGGLLGVGAHFANVLPDLAADMATGVRGLPQRLGGRVSSLLAGTFLGSATAVLAVGPGKLDTLAVFGLSTAAAVICAGVAGVIVGPRHGAGRALTRLAVITAGLFDVVLLMARAGQLS